MPNGYNINAILKVTNQFTQPLNQFKQQMNDIRNNVNNATNGVKNFNNATRNTSGISNMTNRIKGLATAYLSLSGAKKLITGIFDSASEMEGYRNTLNVVMKDTELAGKKMKEAKEFANSTPFETDEIVAGMVKLESYGISSSKEVMTAVGDMAGVMGKSFDQAVEAVADAQTGELERLKEFGIKKQDIIDYANQKMNNAEIVNNKGQITDQEKFNEALMGLMKERYAGGMDLQAKTAKGVISTTRGMIGNIMSIIGGVDDEGNVIAGGLLDTVKNVVMAINNKIKELNDNGTFKRWGENINKVIGIVKNLGATFIKYKGIIIPIIAGIPSAFAAFKAINTAKKAITGFKAALAGLNLAISPIGMIAIAIGAVVAALIYAYQHSETFRNVVNSAVEAVKEKFETFRDRVQICLEAIQQFLESHKEEVSSVKEFISGVIELMISILGTCVSTIGTMLSGLIDVIIGVVDMVRGIFDGDWNEVWEGFKEVVKGAIEIVEGWWNGLLDLFNKPINFVVNLFKKDQSETETVSSEEVGKNAKGTNNWRGGLTWVNEEGGELINLPNGTQIIPHDLSEAMVKEHARNVGNGMSINIPKLADTIVVREDADIDRIGEALANKLNIARMRFA